MAEDQLQQSRDESDLDKRRQASKINYWVRGTSVKEPARKPRTLHLVNRSADPVYLAQLRIEAFNFKGWDDDYSNHDFNLPVEGIPPCSELIFKAADLEVMSMEWAGPKSLGDAEGWNVMEAGFIDRDGVMWQRDYHGINEVNELPDGETGVLLGEPQIQEAQECRDEAT
ncbi:hypothetical protein [Streptomyces phaeochromogenes]|uniref:hypothetical protein n=1 Tax=Streptomyces phaeochromogenes TaxID=1923 RepID=UPI00371C49E9